MTYARVVTSARAVAAFGVAALGLAIPISTAADSALLALVVISALVAAPQVRSELWKAARTPPIALALLLFGLLLAGCAWGDAPLKIAFRGLGKYLELALGALLLWAAANPRTRSAALACFAVAVLLNLYVSYSAAAGLPGLRRPEYPIGFKASVTHSVLVSLGAFLFLLWARGAQSVRLRLVFVALAVVCAHNVLFITIGRTGYLVLGLLLAYYVATAFRGWRGPAVAALAVLALAPIAYFSSPNLQKRVDAIASDMAQWKPAARDETSVGQRLEYYRNTLDIFAEHPLTGVGTGGFAAAYAKRVEAAGGHPTVNPHNDYLLIAAQVGVLGLVVLLLFYAAAWRYAARLESALHRDLARGLVIAMAVGGLFNSFLLDHTEGLLLMWLTAVLYAGYNPAPRASTRPA